MNASTLLLELEGLTHHDRIRRMVALGRATVSGDGVATALLAELCASAETYARRLALESIFGSRDGAALAAAVGDVSHLVRHRALALAPRFCDDTQIVAVFAVLPSRALPALLHALRRRGRGALVDRMDLLPYASAELLSVVQRMDADAGVAEAAWLTFPPEVS